MSDAQLPPLLEPPFLVRLEQLKLVSRKIFLGRLKGERRSKRKGQSVEFADYRNYVVGDDLRFLNWNLYARLDRLFLRLFMEEEDLHFYILLDNSLSMDFGTPMKLHYAKEIAAALGFIGLVNPDRVVIEAFNERLTQTMPPLRGRRSLWRLLDFLTKIEAAGPSDLAEITVSGPLLRCYQQNLAAYRAALHDFCTRRGVTYLFTSNQVPFDRLVLTYLRQRDPVR
jgi:uncharacterized protein (DUF58 family)